MVINIFKKQSSHNTLKTTLKSPLFVREYKPRVSELVVKLNKQSVRKPDRSSPHENNPVKHLKAKTMYNNQQLCQPSREDLVSNQRKLPILCREMKSAR